MKKDAIKKVIKAISIIDYVYGALLIAGGGILFLGGTLLASLGVLKSLLPVFGGIAGAALVLAAVFMIGLGVLYIFLGKAISQHKKWGQIVQVILGFISLPSFPIGTAVGVFFIWALLVNKDVKKLFK